MTPNRSRIRPAHLLAAGVAVALCMMIGCKNSEKAFEEARAADTVDAYRVFLENHPEAEQANVAHSRMDLLAAWDSAQQSESIDRLVEFRRGHADSDLLGPALRQINRLALQQVLAPLRAGANSAPKIAELVDRAASTGMIPSELSADEREAVMESLLQVTLLKKAEGNFSTKNIAPAAGPPRTLECSGSGIRVQGHSDQTSNEGTGYRVTLNRLCFFAEDQGASGRLLSSSIMAGTGRSLISASSSRRENVVGRLTVSQQGAGQYLLATELPSEELLQSQSLGQGTIIPNGSGTIFRFKGKVTNFFPGWTIEGDEQAPLTFALTSDYGLVHFCGNGSVTGPDGQAYMVRQGDAFASQDI